MLRLGGMNKRLSTGGVGAVLAALERVAPTYVSTG
jgi:hypothetical protein